MKRLGILFSLFCFCANMLIAQTYESMSKKAEAYKSEYKYVEALAFYQVLLRSDSNNANYMIHTAILLSKVGNLQADEKTKMDYYHSAQNLSQKAISIHPNIADSHYALALAIGRINQNAGSKEKIANSKRIKTELDLCLKLDNTHAGAYHILGHWNRTIAELSAVSKLAVNAMFGGMPEGGTFDEAVLAFQNAIQFEGNYILHYYELAETFRQRGKAGDKELMKETLNKVLGMSPRTPEDPATLNKCRELLKNN